METSPYSGKYLSDRLDSLEKRLEELEGKSLIPEIKAMKELQEKREAMSRQMVDTRKTAPWSESYDPSTHHEGEVVQAYESGRLLVKVEKGNEVLSPEAYRLRYPEMAASYFRASMGGEELTSKESL